MDFSTTASLALGVMIFGAALLGLALLGLRLLAPRSAHALVIAPIQAELEADHDSGVVVAQPGGRVLFANERAREFFGLNGQSPNLETMARQAQPSETFRGLFSASGVARLSVGSRQVEATSLFIPADEGGPARIVVVFRDASHRPTPGLDDDHAAETLSLIAEAGRQMAASLELPATLSALAASLERLFKFDSVEITLWSPDEQVLRPVHHVGNRAYERYVHRMPNFHYKLDEGYTGWIAARRTSLLIADVERFTQAQPKASRAEFPFRSFAGAPLLVGQQLIGTVELIADRPGVYTSNDVVLLNALAAHAAVAIRNAQAYAEQQRRVAELTGVAEITRAIESTDDPAEMYGRLTSDIARLMGVQMVGFLMYDETEKALVAQPPFRGVPDLVVDAYRIPVEPDSAIDKLWREVPHWVSNNVLTDPMVETLGLKPLAEIAGVRATLLAPITVSGRRVGIAQVSNHLNGAPFSEQDIRLLTIFAGQVSAILENARLVREARERAEQAEGLREFSAMAAAGTDLDTILRQAVAKAASLLRFDLGVISLLDETRGELIPHLASLYGDARDDDLDIARIRTDDPQFAYSATRTRRPFITGRAQTDRRIVGLYRPLIERYQVNSVMDVPLIAGDHCLGNLIAAAYRERAFTRTDLQLLATIAAQVASAIERARLAAATDQSLQRRVEQLTALTRVGRELNQTLDLEHILQLVHTEAVQTTSATCGSIALLDMSTSQPSRLALRVGEAEDALTLTALEREAVALGRLHNLPEIAPGAEQAAHPGVRSVLLVPIVTQESVVGLIHLHSTRPEAFDSAAEEIALALAAQTGIAVANAQRYEDQIRRGELLRYRADQLAQLFEISRTVRSDRPLAENLETIAFGLQEAVGFNVVQIRLLDAPTRRLKRIAVVGLPLSAVESTQHIEHPVESIYRLMRPEFQISQSYFLPHERTAGGMLQGIEITPTPNLAPADQPDAEMWQPQDVLIVPLFGSGRELLGSISLDDPRDGRRPDRTVIEVAEIFANQATLAIENARLFQSAGRRADRLLALHHVIERMAALTDRRQLGQITAENLVSEMGFDVCLIAIQDNYRFTLQGKAGRLPAGIEVQPLLDRQNPLSEAMGQNAALLIANVEKSEWASAPLTLALNLKSFLSAPIISQGQTAGALFVGAWQTPSPFAPEDLDLFTILTNQLGAALESRKLEGDNRRRAQQLGALAEVSRTITATLHTGDVVEAVMTNLHRVVAHDSATLWLREGDELRVVAARGFENDAERLGLLVAIIDSALFAEMARTGGAILVPDVHDDARFPGGEFHATRSWLGAPLISKNRIIGALVLDKTEAHFYSSLTPQLLTAFANQAAVALDNARLFEENEERQAEIAARSQRLALLNRVSDSLTRSLNATQMFEILAQEVREALSVDRAAIFTSVPDGRPALSLYLPLEAEPTIPLMAVFARMSETLAPIVIEDITTEPLVEAERSALTAHGIKSLMALPLVSVSGTLLAVLQVEETLHKRRFTPGELEIAQTLANQTAIAVQNAHLFAETQTRAVELTLRNDRIASLNRLSTTLSATLDVDVILEQAAREILDIFAVDHTSLIMFEPAAQVGYVEAEQPDEGALGLQFNLLTDPLALHLLERQLVTIDDVATDLRLSEDFRTRLASLNINSMVAAPLVSQSVTIGAFTLDSEVPRQFTPDELELCQTIAAQVAVALTNAQFARDLETRVAIRTKELQRERERVENLLQITTELSSSLDLDRVLSRALQLVTEAVHATQGSIFLIDLQTDQLMYRAALGSPKVLLPGGEPAPFKKGEGLVGWVIKNRQSVVINDLEQDTRWKRIPGQNVNHRSAMAVPLLWNEDVLGAILLFSPTVNAFDEEQLRLVTAAANQVGSASNNAELYRLIRDQAERLGNLLRAQQVETTKNRSILEGIADGVLVADADGQVILFNAACERILGLKRDEIMGRPITEYVGIYGAQGRAWIDSITRWSLDPTTYMPGDFATQRLELADKRVLSVTLAPVMTGDEYLGSVSLIRDITREVEVDRMKSQIITNVSHELRTPLTPAKGWIDMLLLGAGGPLSPMQKQAAEVIKASVDRLTSLVDDMLDISRIESTQAETILRPTSPQTVMAAALQTLQAEIEAMRKTLHVETDVPMDLPPILADQDKLVQALNKLTDNALHYTPAGGMITLRAHLDESQHEIHIEVSDTGSGIAPEYQPLLFDKFFRGEKNPLVMASAGTGLGLSIAKQLVEKQNGRLWLKHTEEGQGTTFAIALPVVELPA